MSLTLTWSSSFLLCVLANAGAISNYNEASAIKYTYMSISSYCGAPKFETLNLESWDCGPSCNATGTVTDITTFAASDYGVFGFVGHHQGSCVLAFRGTYDNAGTTLDEEWNLVDYAGCAGCQMHEGLVKGYAAVKSTIELALTNLQCTDLSITGHSLGGSLSIVAAFDLGTKFQIKENYNFGAYRVGNAAFANAYDAKHSAVTFRVTHQKDPIPLGPLASQGFEHVGGEIYYAGDISEGYKVCEGHEDLSCIDQYCPPSTCGWGSLTFFALLNSKSHLTYMTPTVQLDTDGESCAYVSVSRVAQQAHLATAAYCPAEDLKTWSCGKPCEKVTGGVESVVPLEVPITLDNRSVWVKGFVGRWQEGCVMSLADPFGTQEGFAMLEQVQDMEDLGLEKTCPGCKVSSIVKDLYGALKAPLQQALNQIGCVATATSAKSRRLAVTGHGIGAAIASLAAFELQNGTGYTKGSFGVECSFNFGSPRVGNAAFASAFRARLGGSVGRVTHHMDPFVEYPTRRKGFEHDDEELFFDSDATLDKSSYVRCTQNGDDSRCSMRYNKSASSLADHTRYMQPLLEVNMEVASCGSTSRITIV